MIEHGRLVSIEYTLTLDDGSTADTNVGEEPLFYVQGDGEILEALEDALAGLDVNDEKRVRIPPSRATARSIPRRSTGSNSTRFPRRRVTSGRCWWRRIPTGNQRPRAGPRSRADGVVLDFNHPLAGQALNFAVRIVAIELAAPADSTSRARLCVARR